MLSGSLFTQFSNYILVEKRQQLGFLESDAPLLGSYIGKENLEGSCDHPIGEVMQAKASKIVTLCYFPSIFYLNNYYKKYSEY